MGCIGSKVDRHRSHVAIERATTTPVHDRLALGHLWSQPSWILLKNRGMAVPAMQTFEKLAQQTSPNRRKSSNGAWHRLEKCSNGAWHRLGKCLRILACGMAVPAMQSERSQALCPASNRRKSSNGAWHRLGKCLQKAQLVGGTDWENACKNRNWWVAPIGEMLAKTSVGGGLVWLEQLAACVDRDGMSR